MAMQKREKILAVVTGVLVVAVGVPLLFSGGVGVGSLGTLRKNRDDLQAEVAKKKAQLALAGKAADQMAQFQRRSLPADRELAGSLYQDWLREKVTGAGLRVTNFDPGEPHSGRGAYWRFRFTILARGTLEQVTRFLYQFYSADHLHQIRRLTFKPIEDSDQLNLAIFVEALSLPGADLQDELSTETSKRLKLPESDDRQREYVRAIVRRKMEEGRDGDEARFSESGGLFAAYEPPRPKVEVVVQKDPDPPPPKPPGFDLTKHTYVTSIVEVDGRPQVWLDVRPKKGPQLRLHPGDPFEIGESRGTIRQIEPRFVSLEINGDFRRIKLGNNLHQAEQGFPREEPPPRRPDTEQSTMETPEAEDPAAEELETVDSAVEEPTTQEPGTEDVATNEPETEEPATEEPATEEPGIEQPATEESETAESAAEKPATEAPGTEEPAVEEAGEEESDTAEPAALGSTG